uniref:Uncharacterized protein n=1 Tax=viral metagenome TaxID=1070528 RepID=A0A6C0ARE1_9ZZZZ
MLNTYIKNRGVMKTILHDHNKNKVNEINWDADYDGDNANIILTSTTDGKKKQIGIQLDNNDLANLLNIPTINMPIHRRLREDFIKEPSPKLLQIQLPEEETDLTDTDTDTESPETIEFSEMKLPETIPIQTSIEDLLTPKNYLSSPLPDDKLIIPITINDRPSHDYTLTSRKLHRRPKTHKSYRVYKVHKKPHRSSRRSSKSISSKISTPKSSKKTSRKSSKFSIF